MFEDFILQCLMIFSRDVEVAATAKQALLMTSAESDGRYPPSKVLPFYGFSLYCAPICFLYSDPVFLYLMFRRLYLRYVGKCTVRTQLTETVGTLFVFIQLPKHHFTHLVINFFTLQLDR